MKGQRTFAAALLLSLLAAFICEPSAAQTASQEFELGTKYLDGIGVPKDEAKGIALIRKAAEQGDARAQTGLGICYGNGLGVPLDYAEAFKWYRKAAEQGYALAQNNLGVCYGNGLGVPMNDVEAYKWFNLAAAQGEKSAAEARQQIAARMTPDQIAEAQRLSSAFVPRKEAAPQPAPFRRP